MSMDDFPQGRPLNETVMHSQKNSCQKHFAALRLKGIAVSSSTVLRHLSKNLD